MEQKIKNKVLLLVNTGTPDSPEVKDVRRYLSEFLNDKRVINLPWLARKILVNLIIVPFRATSSAKRYRKLWTEKGSPLRYYMDSLVLKVQKLAGVEYRVMMAMRYGSVSLKEIMNTIKNSFPDKIIILPLFPQYSSSTTGSVNEFIMNEIKTWEVIPEVNFCGQFYSHPAFLEALTEQINKYEPDSFDHVLFSYHGLPLKHLQKICPGNDCRSCNCNEKLPENGEFCYRATCYETTRLLSEKMNLDSSKCSTSFQSRLSKNWLTPFTDVTLKELAASGKKSVLIIPPSFVADCLETIIEINNEYKKIFIDEGGEKFIVSESLNDNDKWANAIINMTNL